MSSKKLLLPISKSVLYTLGRMAEDAIWFTFNSYRFRSAFNKGGIEYARLLKRQLTEASIKRSIRELARNKFIKIKKLEKRLIISLNDKGRLALLQNQLQHIKPGDGVCTVVVFDIPEAASSARRKFRRWLKNCHFKMLQRSVWITDRDVADLVNKALPSLRLPGWIITLTTLSSIVHKSYQKI